MRRTARSRRVALGIGLIGSLTLITSAWLGRDALVETWHILQLESTRRERRLAAAERLAEMRSIRAVPSLLRCIRGAPEERSAPWRAIRLDPQRVRALETEAPAKEQRDENGVLRLRALPAFAFTPIVHALYRIGPEADAVLPPDDPDPRVDDILDSLRVAWRTGCPVNPSE